MVDESPDSVNDAAFAVGMTGNRPVADKWQDGPSTLHDGGCSFTFADGHVEVHKWVDPAYARLAGHLYYDLSPRHHRAQ